MVEAHPRDSGGDCLVMNERYSANEIAAALKQPAPTLEQAAIISAPLESSIVIAGAGSGKTETMANRVVYLVANGMVTAQEVLGLTFTRKAAGELSERIRKRLAGLAASGLAIPAGNNDDMFGATVTTYNAFANRIFGDYAHLIGRDPDAGIMSEATAWQLALEVARGGDRQDMLDIDKKLGDVADGILNLARAINDNMIDPASVAAFGQEFIDVIAELDEGKATKGHKEIIGRAVSAAKALPLVVDLVHAYESQKQANGFMEFSDQVARAYEIVTRFSDVGAVLRSQYKVVLLDEYQDTSSVQIELLSTLFRGVAVTAVGDPNQAIYGWRGASASSMDTKPFFDKYAPGAPPRIFTLPHSWRNPQVVLDAANAIAAPLPQESDVSSPELKLGSEASTGSLTVVYPETVDEEATAVAEWFDTTISSWQPRPDVGKDQGIEKPTAALLVRRVADLEPFKRALDKRDVPYRVVGLGGLLVDPVIVDLVCALRVMHFASADSELIRLLSGPRWRIAPRDLKGLNKAARWLSDHDYAHKLLSDSVKEALAKSVSAEDGASLVDALDFIADRKDKDHGALSHLSQVAFERLRDAGQLIAGLRRRAGLDLRELVTVVLQAFDLDIEGEANDTTASVEPVISAFMDAVGTFLGTATVPTLGAFLTWLEDAERRDRMSPAAAEPEPGVVQLMTIHGAKGLEWHLVAVPRQATPASGTDTRNAKTWLDEFGKLPDELRSDYRDLEPWWKWRTASDMRELAEDYGRHKEGVKVRYLNEQRRLSYVAVTRSMQHLMVSGSFWAGNAKPAPPNEYLVNIAEVTPGVELPVDSIYAKAPEGTQSLTVLWPPPPLDQRETRVRKAAELVGSSTAEPSPEVAEDIRLLVAERARALEHRPLPLPVRVAASKFKDFIDDASSVAKAMRRPLPTQPYRATMLGTIFHAWVESRGKQAIELQGIDFEGIDFEGTDVNAPSLGGDYEGFTLDAVMSGADSGHDVERADAALADVSGYDEAKLAALEATFEASEWGQLTPYEVELEIQLPLGRNIVICKIDAIYRHETAGGVRYDIVDWKTGKSPSDARDLEVRQLQLALYRLAFATWKKVPIESVDVAFYFVSDDKVIRPERVFGEAELIKLWTSVYER